MGGFLLMHIAVLTSSRADFGIYLPLLNALKKDDFFELKLIVFGTHLSKFHGYTVQQIESENFTADYKIDNILTGDSPAAIANSMGLTQTLFANFWANYASNFDIVFCLGDRYEMFAAVVAGIPFGIKFAHLHGGETTTGAIDNIFRHGISLASTYHFTATEKAAERLMQLIASNNNVYPVGSLALDGLANIPLLSVKDFKEKWNINLSIDTLLCTMHPETVNVEGNESFAHQFCMALEALPQQKIITLPNADTSGAKIREIIHHYFGKDANTYIIENLGSVNYFSVLKNCLAVVGNSSSGIIEAASFNKWVINIGERQSGREQAENVINIPFNKEQIIAAVQQVVAAPEYTGSNVYFKNGATANIVNILKSIHK